MSRPTINREGRCPDKKMPDGVRARTGRKDFDVSHIAQPTRVRNSLGRAGFTSASGGLEKAVRGRSAKLPSASCRPPQFLLRLEATRGDAIHDLRSLLKTLLRRHGFRCIDCREAAR